MPSQVAYLYLLVFPAKNVVKVGKAIDILNRLATLKRWWGEPDYDASYCVKAEESLVFRLERINLCEGCGSGEVIQFEINSQLLADGERRPDVLQSLLTQAVRWVEELPRRSPATVEEIPVLNISLRDFFEQPDARDTNLMSSVNQISS